MKNFHIIEMSASGSLYEERNKHAQLMETVGIQRHEAYTVETNFLDGIIKWRVLCTDNQLTMLLMHGGTLSQDQRYFYGTTLSQD
jgi:hypothetical protein